MAIDTSDPHLVAFWQEYHLPTLTTLRVDGTPHVVPVGATYDAGQLLARVITRKTSVKAANILETGPAPARVALCQVSGGRWATLEGAAHVRTDPELIADAVSRYAERYGRMPGPDPDRVLIEIEVDSVMGQVALR